MTDTTREPGFYWVRWHLSQTQEVAEYAIGYWWRCGVDDPKDDTDFTTIGPRILPPEETETCKN